MSFPTPPWAVQHLQCQLVVPLQNPSEDPTEPEALLQSSGPGGKQHVHAQMLSIASSCFIFCGKTLNKKNKKSVITVFATCSNSSVSCCFWATSLCKFSVFWLSSFWTWWQTQMDSAQWAQVGTNGQHIHADMQRVVAQKRGVLYSHTDKSCSTCVPS